MSDNWAGPVLLSKRCGTHAQCQPAVYVHEVVLNIAETCACTYTYVYIVSIDVMSIIVSSQVCAYTTVINIRN